MNANELWNSWGDIHNDPDQINRLRSAQKAELTPIKIDHNDNYGYFQGSHGNYETFLDHCTCFDFNHRKKPCKHIYRLAIELNLLNETAENNPSKIKSKPSISTEDIIALIETLPDDSKRLLLSILYRNIYNEKEECLCEMRTYLSPLISAGLLTINHNYETLLKMYTRNSLNDKIASSGIQVRKNMKFDLLRQWCIENISHDTLEIWTQDFESFTISDFFNPLKHRVYKYLHRLYDFEDYFDPDTGNLERISILDLPLPDDNITQLLYKYNHIKNS